MENVSYIRIVQELERIIPQTTEYDYRVVHEKMWADIKTLFENTGLMELFSHKELSVFEKEVKGRLDEIQEWCRENRFYPSFDRNNDYLKKLVSNLRKYVLNTILSKKDYTSDLAYVETDGSVKKYGPSLGSDEEIEKVIHPSNVANYIRGLLTVSKLDGTSQFDFNSERIVNEIYDYFGFREHTDENEPDKFEIEARVDIDTALSSSIVYRSIDVPRDYYHSSEKYNAKLEELINKLTGIVLAYTRKALGQKQTFNLNEEETSKIRPMEVEPQKVEETSDMEYSSTISKYDRITELIEENRRLIQQVNELKQTIKQNNIEIQRIELEEEAKTL